MKNKIMILLIAMLTISGCNQKASSLLINNSSPTSTITTSTSSTSDFKGYVDLAEAYSNTKYYGLRLDNEEIRPYYEIFTEDLYYLDIKKEGYVELESDPGYLHEFTSKYVSGDLNDTEMIVYGRSTYASNLSVLEKSTIKGFIANAFSGFEQVDERTYSNKDTVFIREIADYFQSKMYKYATEIVLTIGKNNRLDEFKIVEEGYSLLSLKFENIKKEDLKMYQYWVNNGSIIQERIYDYKALIEDDESIISVYEGEEVEFEATVVAKDHEGNIYVANRDDNVGHIGIKVTPNANSDSVNIKDVVKVNGKIKTKDYNTYLINSTVKDTNKDNKYTPYFDEDSLVDANGGGVYAANLFYRYSFFNDSLYSTFAYVNNISNNDNNQDLVIDLVFPSQVSGEKIFHMEAIIPKELSTEKKENLYNEFINASKYGSDDAYELRVENFIIKYDYQYRYKIKLMATEESNVLKRPTISEKLAQKYGLENFPLPLEKEMYSYYFGGFTNQFLESDYDVETKETEGLFISINNLSYEEKDSYLSDLETYGVIKYDEVKDKYSIRHIIYQKGINNIDMIFNYGDYEETVSINMWIYSGNVILPKLINERLNDKIGSWFDVDNFLKLSGTYDADYEIYALRTYLDKFYSEDEPLYCVTIDTKEKIFDDYNKALIQMGYKQYRNENNKPYTYKTRGQNHYIFEKDGVYLDVATYHTSDYTYTGHKEFEYRLEILIYKGTPMSVDTYDDLSVLSNLYNEIDPSLAYYPELPDDAVVEVWRNIHDFKLSPVNYGYGNRDEAFVYTSYVDEAYESVKEAAIEAGFTLSVEKTRSALFSKTVNGTLYNIFLLKEPEKGYLRVMNDIGGVDFFI